MRMRLMLLPMFLAAPLAAQAFEGTVTMKVGAGEQVTGEAKYFIKGDKLAVAMSMAQMQGIELRMLINTPPGKMTTLIPATGPMASRLPAGTKGMKRTVDMDAEVSQTDMSKFQVKKLGTTQTIAGNSCDDFEMTDGTTVTKFCLATTLGRFVMPGGGMGGRSQQMPAWAKAVGGKGGFPLKVQDAQGRVLMEVLKIERGSVPASTFEIPEGYMDMGNMMGGGRP